MANPGPASSSPVHPQLLGSNQAIRLLAVATGVNLNATGDTIVPIINSSNWSVYQIIVTNASTSLTTAKAGVYPAASAGGTAFVANTTALTGNTGSTVVNPLTVANTTVQTGANIYINVGTAQGAAATADIYIYGYDFSVQS
jgi:hypothetical protein